MIKALSQVPLLPSLPIMQHQTPAVALVSWPHLRAIGDVLPIRRVEGSLICRRVVGSDVPGMSQNPRARPILQDIHRHGEQIIVGAGGFDCVVI